VDILNNNIHSYREKMRALVDFVQFTIPIYISFDVKENDIFGEKEVDEPKKHGMQYIYDLLQIPGIDFLDMKHGLSAAPGYKRHKQCGNIHIMYDGTANMGTHIIITGQGCREYEQRMLLRVMDNPEQAQALFVWRELFMRVLGAEGWFTRLDAAIDDFKPYFTLTEITKRIDWRLCSSLFDKVKEIRERSISTGESDGMTLYFGSDKSDMQIVMYEKIAERKNAGVEIEEDLKAWNRIEIRMFDNNTYEFIRNVVDGHDLGKLISRVLVNYIKFQELRKVKNAYGKIVDSTDSNQSRWTHWRKWSAFIGGVDKLKLNHIAPDRTIEKSMRWIDEKVKRSLGRIFVAEPLTTLEWIQQKIIEGTEKLNENDENMIKAYWRNKEAMEQMMKELSDKKNAAFDEVAASKENDEVD
jgi:phage replication initiation protein